MMLVAPGMDINFFSPLLVVELKSVFGISGFILCSCVQIRNWFDYRNHICIVSIYWCFCFD